MDCDKLQALADKLTDFLLQKQVITRKEFNSVVLHMTVMNVSFLSEHDLAMDTADGGNHSVTFDCSNIMRKLSGWDFGVLEVGELCLSKRYGGSGTGYYNSAASFKIGS